MKKQMTDEEYENYRLKIYKYIEKLNKEIRKLKKEIDNLKYNKYCIESSLKQIVEENNRFNQINTGKGLYYDITIAPAKLRNEISYLEKLSSFEYLSENDKQKYLKRIEELQQELIKADAKAKELTVKEGETLSNLRIQKNIVTQYKSEIKRKENQLVNMESEKRKYLNNIRKVDEAVNRNKGINPKLILEPNEN